MLKWILRYVTGKCELLRITYEETEQKKRTKRIEWCLNHSSNENVRKFATDTEFDVSEAVKFLMEVKDVLPEVHSQFEASLKECLTQIRSYNRLVVGVDRIRSIKYDADNEEHEKDLKKLWFLYNQDAPLPSRTGSHWQDMGFQGHDPKTDFRGMGILGLQQMIYFAVNYPDTARRVFSQSHHPQYGFSFAIVAINITGMAFELLNNRKLRSHFYSLDKSVTYLSEFDKVYCYILNEFAQQWIEEKPKDIMEFSRVRDKVFKQIKVKLRSDEPILEATFQKV